jgi:hypothetical protein
VSPLCGCAQCECDVDVDNDAVVCPECLAGDHACQSCKIARAEYTDRGPDGHVQRYCGQCVEPKASAA